MSDFSILPSDYRFFFLNKYFKISIRMHNIGFFYIAHNNTTIHGTHADKEIYLSYQGNKIVSTKGIVNFTKYLFVSYR